MRAHRDGQIFTEGINSEANIKEHWWTNYLDRRNLKGAAFSVGEIFLAPKWIASKAEPYLDLLSGISRRNLVTRRLRQQQ